MRIVEELYRQGRTYDHGYHGHYRDNRVDLWLGGNGCSSSTESPSTECFSRLQVFINAVFEHEETELTESCSPRFSVVSATSCSYLSYNAMPAHSGAIAKIVLILSNKKAIPSRRSVCNREREMEASCFYRVKSQLKVETAYELAEKLRNGTIQNQKPDGGEISSFMPYRSRILNEASPSV